MADTRPENEKPRRKPAIRTMQADVAEFLARARPSLVNLVAGQAEFERSLRHPGKAAIGGKLKIAGLIFGLIILVLGAGGIWLWLGQKSRTAKPEIPAPEPAFIFFEETEETGLAKTRQELTGVLREAGEKKMPKGSFRRLVIKIQDSGGFRAIAAEEFFELLGIRPPEAIAKSAASPPQFFIYFQNSGPLGGIMFQTNNAPRTLQGLHDWEPAMAYDLGALFLNAALPAATSTPFKDQTYRNIDFRHLELDPGRGIGPAYFHFPGRRLVVIAASEAAVRAVINRLLETH